MTTKPPTVPDQPTSMQAERIAAVKAEAAYLLYDDPLTTDDEKHELLVLLGHLATAQARAKAAEDTLP